MKIEISEQPTNEPVFPAFYRDSGGGLWYWGSSSSYVDFRYGDIDVDREEVDVDFSEFNVTWEFVRVQGTITITV